jgi:PAS domain S-box-containing protein
MKTALRLLLIEDTEEDALLLERELARSGYDVQMVRVWAADELRAALTAETWDVVVSDWSLPLMDGLEACKIVRSVDPDVPFLIISGTIDEELAIDALRAGADDFMSKNRLARLGPAIARAMRDRATRRKERESSAELDIQRVRIARSERLLRRVLDTVPDGVLVATRDRRILEINPAARALFELGDDENDLNALYDRWQFTLADKTTPLERDTSPLARALDGEVIDGFEIVGKKADGVVRHFVVSIRPLEDERSGPGDVVAMVRDITGERATQEQLMLSDRLASVGMLAAGVAHEINNPLAACLANLDMLKSSVETDTPKPAELAEAREMLADASHAAHRVREIVRDLKIFARHEDSTNNAVDLKPTLESTARMAWNEIRHRATLVKEYGVTQRVRGSDSRLGQVFLNLLVNAAQAIPAGNARANTIRIRTGMQSPDVAFVEISDTGAGMSTDTLRKLFTPFFTTKPKGEGTGLGLAIVYRIVRGLGGDVEVESDIGKGTLFRVLLPTAKRTTRDQPPLAALGAPAAGLRILVVDDEPILLQAFQRALGRDHDVKVTTRASEALTWIRAGERFDAIVSDLMMPEMTGMDLYAHLAEAGLADRMIFMTGGAFTTAAREFLDRVPNPRLEKPFDRAQLLSVLAMRPRN